MSAEKLQRASDVTAGVLANVKADQLDDPTPCKSWKVRDLINHLVAVPYMMAGAVGGEAGPEGEVDYASADYNAAYAEGVRRAVAAFSAEGAMDKMVEMPFGTMPAEGVARIATTDAFTHAWDLARATGQSTDLDPELADELLTGARAFIQDGFRGEEPLPFSAAVDVPEDAPKADQLAGFLGRTP